MSDTYYPDLIRKLRNRRVCIQATGNLNDHGLLKDAADAIEELLSRCTECREATDKAFDNINKAWHEKYEKDVPKWIPAEERLPDKGGTYLIACGNGLITTDEFMVWPDRVKTYYNWDDYCGGIKYWMEIPKPPKEVSE